MADPDAMDVDPSSSADPAQDGITVTVEQTTSTTTLQPDNPAQPAQISDVEVTSSFSATTGQQPRTLFVEETHLRASEIQPQTALVSDVFSLPAPSTTNDSSLSRPPVSSGASNPQNPSQQSSVHTNGDHLAASRNTPTPDLTTVSQPNLAPSVRSATGDLLPMTRPSSPARMVRTGYIYDPLMMLHCQDGYTPTADHIQDAGDGHPEEPMRIKRIFARLAESGLVKRMKRLEFAQVTYDQVLLVHTEDHWNKVQGTESELPDERSHCLPLKSARSPQRRLHPAIQTLL